MKKRIVFLRGTIDALAYRKILSGREENGPIHMYVYA